MGTHSKTHTELVEAAHRVMLPRSPEHLPQLIEPLKLRVPSTVLERRRRPVLDSINKPFNVGQFLTGTQASLSTSDFLYIFPPILVFQRIVNVRHSLRVRPFVVTIHDDF
ncbi:hypothetical protein LTR16_009103, partial [Cryomyces antarcticus]